MIKVRKFEESNYKAIFHNYKTLRMALDPSKPILELEYPEFYDVAINDKCNAMCSWCYVSAKKTGSNFSGILDKIDYFFGMMTENQKPFQVAIGGAGEPTLHPEFIDILKKFDEVGVVPNYTTNGMHLTDEIIEATKKYSGGVAISCHPHLDKYWKSSAERFIKSGIRTNFHVIISDTESIDKFFEIYEEYSNKIEYFVLLPYTVKGRAKETNLEFDDLFARLKKLEKVTDIAFGANFYPYLMNNDISWLDVSLYEPEIMSKYIVMDNNMNIYDSSFSDEPINKEKKITA